MRKLALIILLHFADTAFGQSISGTIKDALTDKPIAFANLKIPNSRRGTSTDIDGKFTLKTPNNYSGNILISHVGYERLVLNNTDLGEAKISILLTPKTTNLQELVFLANENPANAIIRKAVANRKQHDPNRLTSYQYKSYGKKIIKLDDNSHLADSILWNLSQIDTLRLSKRDSSVLKLDSITKSHHAFMTESVTEKKFLNPGLVTERLLAINTSGIKSPLLATTGTDYQPLGFYDEVITILDKPHTNPLASGTLRRYEFYLEDTTFYQQDSVFVMSFRPKKGKKFESLHGQISISKNGYAIRNVIAHSTDSLAKTSITIQQFYQCLNNVWFPTQINTDIVFKELDFFGRRMLLEARTYFTEIEINQRMSKNEFSDVALELNEIEEETNLTTLSNYRIRELDSLELKTYLVLDSLGQKLNTLTNLMEVLITQRIPIGKFDLSINKLVQFNKYENARIGLGGLTNHQFSSFVQIGAYMGYGFGDKAWKYGGNLKLQFHKRTNTYFKFEYTKDLKELGQKNHFDDVKVLNKQRLRSIAGSLFDFEETIKIGTHSRIAPFTYSQIVLAQIHSAPSYVYNYSREDGSSQSTFDFTELSLSMRYVKKEKYLNFKGRRVPFGNSYPIVTLNYTQGIADFLNGDFDYHQFTFSFDYEKKSRFGETKIYFKADFIEGDVPLSMLFTGQGINSLFFVVPHHFQTMGLYEFLSDREISLFVNHNFGNILLNNKYMKPELVLYQNISIGELSNQQRHQDFLFDTLESGYFESGIGFQNLIRLNYLDIAYFGIGTDLFYRSGAYAFTKTSDNFVVRFNFDFTF